MRVFAWCSLSWMAVLATALCAASAPAAVAGVAAASVDAATRAELLALVEERSKGLRGDKAAWRRHVADDCVFIGNGLKVVTADEVEAAQVDVGVTREIQDFDVRSYGDVAVLTYLAVERVPQGGATKVVRLRKSDTYARLQGQ